MTDQRSAMLMILKRGEVIRGFVTNTQMQAYEIAQRYEAHGYTCKIAIAEYVPPGQLPDDIPTIQLALDL